MKSFTITLLCLLLLGVHGSSLAQTEVMPSVEKVKTVVKGDNQTNTYLKQAGAFSVLRSILHALDGDRLNPLSESERLLDSQYAEAYDKLVKAADIPSKPFNEKQKLLDRYERAASFRQELYPLLFPTGFGERVDQLVAERYLHGSNPTPDFEGIKNKEESELTMFNLIVNSSFFLIAILAGLFVWSIFFRNRVSYPPDDIYSLQIGGKRYSIRSFVGEVIYKDISSESFTRVSGNYQQGFSSSTTNYTHERFSVIDETGKERSLHWVNSKLFVRVGAVLSAFWLIKGQQAEGYYFYFRNHNTSEYELRKKYIRRHFGAGFLPVIFLFLISFLLAFSGLGWYYKEHNIRIDLDSLIFYVFSTGTIFYCLGFGLVLYLVLNEIVKSIKFRQFNQSRMPLLLEDLNQRAQKFKEK